MRVIAHIGTPKTGSSAIQQALYTSRASLAAHRILTFSPEKLTESALFMAFEREDAQLNPEVRLHFSSVDEARAWSLDQWNEFERAAITGNYDTAVVSSEHFVNMVRPQDLLERLSRNFEEVQCIVYLRDPVSFYTSQLDQLLRGGSRLRDLPGPDKYNFHHVQNIIRFKEAFGEHNVRVRPFSRDRLVDRDVVADFEHTMAAIVGSPVALTRPPPTNESTPGIVAAWCAAANAQAAWEKIDYPRRKLLIDAVRTMPTLEGAPRLSLKGTSLEQIILHRSRNNCRVANDRFFGGEQVFKVAGKPPKDTSWNENYQELVQWLTSYIPEPITRELAATTLLIR